MPTQPQVGATVTFTLGSAGAGAGAGAGGGAGAGASFAGGAGTATATTGIHGIATSPSITAGSVAGAFTATATDDYNQHRPLHAQNRAGEPAAITAGIAAAEATQAGTRFVIALAVTVTDALGNKIPGALVTFTAPASGPSGSFATTTHPRTVTVRTDSGGVAVAPPFIADAQPGGYVVIARVAALAEDGVRARQRGAMTAAAASLTPARLRTGDLARLATIGVRTRRLRAALSALGIAIGVAAIVAVLGISSSSQAGLLAEINQLGTNLLDVTTGQNFSSQPVPLPLSAPAMIGRIAPVYDVAYTGTVANANAYRTPLIPAVETNALSVAASNLNLPGAVGTTLAQGALPQRRNRDRARLRARAAAARRLGIDRVSPGERIWVGGMWFYVAGILDPAPLAPEIDDSVLIGFPAAKTYLGYASVVDGRPAVGNPTEIYVRAETDQVNAV